MNIEYKPNSNSGQMPGGRFPTETGYSSLKDKKIEVSSVLKDKILIVRELARQCSKNIENQTPEEDENEIVYKTLREIISWQVKDGLTGEEISQITRAFGERLKELEKNRIDDKINALLPHKKPL